MRLRVDDALVFGIHRCHAGVALDGTFVRGHLRTLVVRAIGPTVPPPTQRRSARPANTFVIRPACTAACPFTNTQTMPLDKRVGST